jgi:peptidoglycan/LPS O-acetylase OafA/YrhL
MRRSVNTASSGRLPALDGLRGIAVLVVVGLHTDLLPAGWLGVDVFFVLSGYLITSILLEARAASDSWRAILVPFYMRRTLRIIPIALLVLAVMFLLLPRLGLAPEVPMSRQLWFWTFLANWRPGVDPPGVESLIHYWSLAMEEQFYLVWPWLVLAVAPAQMRAILTVAVAVPFITRVAFMLSGHPALITVTPLRLDGLLWGALVAYGGRVALSGPMILALAGVAVWCSWGPLWIAWRYALAPVLVTLTAVAVVVAIRDRAVWTEALAWRPLAWVGTVSYAVYLVHVPIAFALRDAAVAPWANLALTLPISLGLAALSCRYVEAPILSLKRHWPMPTAAFVRAA